MSASANGPGRPNILFFQCDDLELEDFGAVSGERHTPNIDWVIGNGTYFERSYCGAAICTPSRYEWLTGRFASRCTGPGFSKQNPPGQPACVFFNTEMDEQTPDLGSVLGAAGYRTGYFGKWHCGAGEFDKDPCLTADADPDDPEVDAALQRYQASMVQSIKRVTGFDDVGAIAWGNKESFPVKRLAYHWSEWITSHAVEMIQSCEPGQPFFVQVATSAPHGDVHWGEYNRDTRYTTGGKLDEPPPGSELRQTLQTRLKEAGCDQERRALVMLHLDDQLGMLLDAIRARGELDRTIVVVSCDHNSEPGKATCYDEGVRIPMAAAWPGVINPGTRCDALVENVDWLPTFTAAAGGTIPEEVDGKDLRPLFEGKVEQVRETIFLNVGWQRAVTDGRYKYIAYRPPEQVLASMAAGELDKAPTHVNSFSSGQACVAMECYPDYFVSDQLYDLGKDPDEQVNVIDRPEHAQIQAHLRAQLRSYLDTFPDQPFDLAPPEFLQTSAYAELGEKTREACIGTVPWWVVGSWTPRAAQPEC